MYTKVHFFYYLIILGLFACESCSSRPSKGNHRHTVILNDSLYVETYETYAGNATTTGLFSVYFTDSIHFRKYIGTGDDADDYIFGTIKNSNEVVFYLISSRLDPIAFKKNIYTKITDTTIIGSYYIPDLIKDGKFEGDD